MRCFFCFIFRMRLNDELVSQVILAWTFPLCSPKKKVRIARKRSILIQKLPCHVILFLVFDGRPWIFFRASTTVSFSWRSCHVNGHIDNFFCSRQDRSEEDRCNSDDFRGNAWSSKSFFTPVYACIYAKHHVSTESNWKACVSEAIWWLDRVYGFYSFLLFYVYAVRISPSLGRSKQWHRRVLE